MTIKTDGVAEKKAFNVRTRKMAELLYSTFTDMYDNFDTTADQIIAAIADDIRGELSAHEKKVRELVDAAWTACHWQDDSGACHEAHDRLRAALKALEEQPGALGKGKDAV